MSSKHPAAVVVTAVMMLLEWTHVTHFLGFIWEETPPWVKSLVSLIIASFHPDPLSGILGFAMGIAFLIFAPRLLQKYAPGYWPEPPKKSGQTKPKPAGQLRGTKGGAKPRKRKPAEPGPSSRSLEMRDGN